MFNLFANSSNRRIKVTDIIWMTQEAKWTGIAACWKKDQPVIICWFDDTLEHLQSVLSGETGAADSLLFASHLHPSQVGTGRPVLFAEHYPLRKKEMELFERLQLPEAVVHSALDDPFLLHFGGDKIAGLMKQMGMTADESLHHPMIGKAILNAQEKIEKKVVTESLAASAGQWLERNIAH